MNFSDVVQTFRESLPGTDAYVVLRDEMKRLMVTDVENAALYYLIFVFARSYVLLYEDEAVLTSFAEENQKVMLSYLDPIVEALNSNDKTKCYQVASQVALAYLQRDQAF